MNILQKLLFLPVNYRRKTHEHPWVMTEEYKAYIAEYGYENWVKWRNIQDFTIPIAIIVVASLILYITLSVIGGAS